MNLPRFCASKGAANARLFKLLNASSAKDGYLANEAIFQKASLRNDMKIENGNKLISNQLENLHKE